MYYLFLLFIITVNSQGVVFNGETKDYYAYFTRTEGGQLSIECIPATPGSRVYWYTSTMYTSTMYSGMGIESILDANTYPSTVDDIHKAKIVNETKLIVEKTSVGNLGLYSCGTETYLGRVFVTINANISKIVPNRSVRINQGDNLFLAFLKPCASTTMYFVPHNGPKTSFDLGKSNNRYKKTPRGSLVEGMLNNVRTTDSGIYYYSSRYIFDEKPICSHYRTYAINVTVVE